MDIHSRIKARRLELKMSVPELADRVGVSRQAVMLWETPEDKKGTVPDRFKIKKVADQLKTTVVWLTTGIDANLDPNDKYVFIPRYAETLKGMSKVNYHDEVAGHTDGAELYAYRKDALANLNVRTSDCVVVFSNDSSMFFGSQLLVNTADTAPVPSKIYAFKTPFGVLVRRVFIFTDGRIELRTDDGVKGAEIYLPDQLPTILGRVINAQVFFA